MIASSPVYQTLRRDTPWSTPSSLGKIASKASQSHRHGGSPWRKRQGRTFPHLLQAATRWRSPAEFVLEGAWNERASCHPRKRHPHHVAEVFAWQTSPPPRSRTNSLSCCLLHDARSIGEQQLSLRVRVRQLWYAADVRPRSPSLRD